MRIFRNKLTKKRYELDELKDKHIIEKLENDPRYKELVII